MVREKYVKYEGVSRPPEPEKKKGFARVKEVIENFFYHHKFMAVMIVIGILFAIFVIDPGSDKTEPDMEICLVTTSLWYHEFDSEIEALMKMYCKDYNGDGKVKVQVTSHLLVQRLVEGVPMEQQEAYNRMLWAELAAGKRFVYLCDKEAATYLGYGQNVFSELDDEYSTIDWELDKEEIPFDSFCFDWQQLKAVNGSNNLRGIELYIGLRDVFEGDTNTTTAREKPEDFITEVLADRPVDKRAYLEWMQNGGSGNPHPLGADSSSSNSSK